MGYVVPAAQCLVAFDGMKVTAKVLHEKHHQVCKLTDVRL